VKTVLLTLTIFSSLAAAEYAQGKIDMHGGKQQSSYGSLHSKEQTFTRPGFGRFLLFDANQSKEKKPSLK